VIVALSGSLSPRSRSTLLLHRVADRLTGSGASVEHMSLRDVAAEDLIAARYDCEGIKAITQRLQEARAVVVASPVYKASLGGALKSLLDLLPENTMAGKTVLPLMAGGGPGHLLALEYGLKPVFSVLGCRSILTGVYASEKQIQVAEDGTCTLDPTLAARLDDAADALLEIVGKGR
jgi:FMN reductase